MTIDDKVKEKIGEKLFSEITRQPDATYDVIIVPEYQVPNADVVPGEHSGFCGLPGFREGRERNRRQIQGHLDTVNSAMAQNVEQIEAYLADNRVEYDVTRPLNLVNAYMTGYQVRELAEMDAVKGIMQNQPVQLVAPVGGNSAHEIQVWRGRR